MSNERELFEKFANEHKMSVLRVADAYSDDDTNYAWWVWQKARASTTMQDDVRKDAERWQMVCNLWLLSTELTLTQNEDGGYSIIQSEAVEDDIHGNNCDKAWNTRAQLLQQGEAVATYRVQVVREDGTHNGKPHYKDTKDDLERDLQYLHSDGYKTIVTPLYTTPPVQQGEAVASQPKGYITVPAALPENIYRELGREHGYPNEQRSKTYKLILAAFEKHGLIFTTPPDTQQKLDKAREALQFISDNMLLHGSTELHDEALVKLQQALKDIE